MKIKFEEDNDDGYVAMNVGHNRIIVDAEDMEVRIYYGNDDEPTFLCPLLQESKHEESV